MDLTEFIADTIHREVAQADGAIDKQKCNHRLLGLAKGFGGEEVADACGKCAIGPCSLESAVR